VTVVGKLTHGALSRELAADHVRVARVQFGSAVRVPKLSLYADGLGVGAGSARLKAVIYDAAGNLVGLGSEVVIPKGLTPGWVDLPFALPGGIVVPAAVYDVGLIAGGDPFVARVFGDDLGAGTVLGSRSLTLSGGEVNDAVRLLNLSGDGRGYFTVTNLILNGGVETNANGWAGATGFSPIARDTTKAKYGSASLRNDLASSGTPGFGGSVYTLALTPNATYTFSAWVWCDMAMNIGLQFEGTTTLARPLGNTTSVPSQTWTRVTLSGALPPTVEAAYRVSITANNGAYAGHQFWVDGVQVESGPTANAYVETNGAVASEVQGTGDKTTGVYAALTNLLNGSFEADLSGWTAVSPSTAVLTRDRGASKFGLWSMRSDGVVPQALTIAGTPITDAIRAANLSGDGRGYAYVFNLVPNGGFETSTTGFGLDGQTNSLASSTAAAKFGTHSLLAMDNGAGLTQIASDPITVTAGLAYTLGFWVRQPAGATNSNFKVTLRFGSFGSFNTTLTLTSAFQFVSLTAVAPAGATSVQIKPQLVGATGASDGFFIDGVQFEVGATASAYVDTNGTAVGAIQGNPDSSHGIYTAATNLTANGGAETNATGWAGQYATITRTTAAAKFGSACLQVVT
jgi:hypothetical protein